MIKRAISKLVDKVNLTQEEMRTAMTEIMTGGATSAQIGAFITALRMKGETVDEIAGAAMAMREKATKIKVDTSAVDIDREEINIDEETIIDTCGTGGDGTNTFNVSTATAFVVAGTGLKVAKHGNRSVSSHCGSADVLEALGINLNVAPERVEECIKEIGIGFLFAPALHGAMKYAIGPRKEIGIRTVFNILGPLTNPASASVQVLGVYKAELTEVMANVLKKLGSKSAFVVHGLDGLDEITVTSSTQVSQLVNSEIKTYLIHPKDFGLQESPFSELTGGDAKENAGIILKILKGEKGAKRDIVLMNASAAFVAASAVKDFKKGIKMAEDSIESGKALAKLEKLIEMTSKG